MCGDRMRNCKNCSRHFYLSPITALTVDFFTVIFGYLVALDVIMKQPMEVSEGSATD